ncbi:hypothetical protein L3V83_05550 [Thiotrichales bacterium 19X7-9]|nr:hypothetical protein [Thiotrichales bacterium 19X7-9]
MTFITDAEVKHYGEDNYQLQGHKKGVLAITIGIPVRYAHSSSGVIDFNDYENAIKLVQVIIENANKAQLQQLS